MKKIFAILVFIFLAVVLVACGGGAPKVEYLVASPDKITYDKENTNETFEEGHPKIDANNVAVYAIMSNGSVEEISEKTVTSTLIGDGKYEVTVTTGQNQTV